MSRYVVLVLGLLTAATLVGCGRDDAASSTKTPAPLEREDAREGEAPTKETPSTKHLEQPNAEEPHVAVDSTGAASHPERIAVLTPGGPLLVDAWIAIDGQPHTDAFAALVKRVLDAGDTDGDGQSTWPEWAANADFLRGDLANVDPGNKRLIDMWVERYDENRDKQIQPNEAAAWLGRDAGSSVQSLALRSRRSYLPIPSRNSRVWQLLNTQRDGRLSGDELAAAPAKLWSLDADDDRIITPPELSSLRDVLDAAASQGMVRAFDDDRRAAIHLEPPGDVGRLQYLLGDLYAPRQDLGPTSFPDLPGLFESLDTNDDGWLEREELAGLLSIEPHLELTVLFADLSSSGIPAASLRLGEHAAAIEVAEQSATNRIRLSLGGTRLVVSAHDLSRGGRVDGGADRTGVRVMVHDQTDSLFEEIDANVDGRLGEREIATCAERLAALDRNQNGALDLAELPNYMLVAFLRGEAPNERSFYTPASPATPVANGKVPPWFARADFNGDGDVSRREFLGSIDQFSELDANGDGFLSGEEALEVDAESP